MTRITRLGSSAAVTATATAILIVALAVAVGACGDSGPADEYAPRPRGTLTFNKDIAPILFEDCSPCHRPGEAAPFGLLTYKDVKDRAQLIAAVTQSRRMPPWLPVPGYGEFSGERRLSVDELGMIQQWAEEGALEGDPADLPPRPEWSEGWKIGQPDLVIEMPEPYALYAEGPEVFRNFVLPIPVTGTRWVKAVELRPGNARAVHHAVMMVDRSPASRRMDEDDPEPGYGGMFSIGEAFSPDGFFLGWTPGQIPSEGEEDISWQLRRGTDLVLQLHVRPTGQPETIQAAVGFYFADGPPARVPSLLRLGSQTMDIPPGEKRYAIRDEYVLPVDVEVLGLYPHAHYLGKEMQAFATLPDGKNRWLLRIDDWDFNWQGEYRYTQPIFLPKGTTLSMRYTYDNSAENPLNPSDPPVRVVYGPASTDEMGDLWIQVLPRDGADLAILNADFNRKELRALADGFELLSRVDPSDVQARYNLGMALQALGEVDEAMENYRLALQLKPDYAAAHNNLGTLLESNGAADEALEHFRRALAAQPDFAQAHYNVANALQARGDLDGAVQHFRQALEADRNYVEAHYNLGNALAAHGKVDEAIAHYLSAVDIDEGFAAAHYNLGNTLRALGRLDEAIDHYRRALQADASLAAAHNNIGLALEAQGEIESAIDTYRMAIAVDPDLAAAHKNLAILLQSQGRTDEALQQLREVLRIDPDDAQANYNLALGLQSMGRFEDALPHLRRMVESRPGDARLRHNVGLALLSSGRTDEAMREFREASRLQPSAPMPIYTMAWILATHRDEKIRNPGEAIVLAERSVQLTKNRNPLALDALAAAYAAAGRFDRAVPIAEQALTVARLAGATDLANNIGARLELYGQRLPYRDTALR